MRRWGDIHIIYQSTLNPLLLVCVQRLVWCEFTYVLGILAFFTAVVLNLPFWLQFIILQYLVPFVLTWLSWTKLISSTYYQYPSLRTARGLVEAFVHSRFVKSRNLIVLLKIFKCLSQGPCTLTVDLSLQERWRTHRIQQHLITMQGVYCITLYQFQQNRQKILLRRFWVWAQHSFQSIESTSAYHKMGVWQNFFFLSFSFPVLLMKWNWF